MQVMKVFEKQSNQIVPKQNLFQSWILRHNIKGTLQPYSKKGSGRHLHIRLGTSTSPMSLQNQIKNNIQCSKKELIKNLKPAIKCINIQTETINDTHIQSSIEGPSAV